MDLKDLNIISDPDMSLDEWRHLIDILLSKHGKHSVMYIDAGQNNATLKLKIKDVNRKN